MGLESFDSHPLGNINQFHPALTGFPRFRSFLGTTSEGFELSISDGVALAKINPSFYEENTKIKETLTGLVESRLLAVQIMSHRDFILSKPSRSDLREDGSKNIFLEVDPIVIKMSIEPVDLVIRDKDGNIVSDSKRDRLKKQNLYCIQFCIKIGVSAQLVTINSRPR